MQLQSFSSQLVMVSLSALFLFAALGSFPLTDRDEGEYAASVSEMVRSGDYIVPSLNGRPYLEKPILFFWTLVASFRSFGETEFAARFPSALAAFVLILSMLGLQHILSYRKELFILSGVLLLSSPLFLMVARACLTDMLLTLFIWLSMVSFFLFMERWHNSILIGISSLFISLAFLTKGPVALAMCLPVFLLYSLFIRDFSWLKPRRLFFVLLIFLCVNLPWYLAVYRRMGNSFLETFFYTQNFERFFETLLGHGGGPLFYPLVLTIGLFPFSALMPRLLKRDFFFLKDACKGGKPDGDSRFLLFCSLSYSWIFILLSVAATKQINYIVPLLPFLCVQIASLLLENRRWQHIVSRSLLFVVSRVLMLFSGVMALGAAVIWKHLFSIVRFDSTEYAFPPTPPWQLSAWGAALFVLVCISNYLFVSKGKEMAVRFVAALLFAGFVVILFLPGICNLFQLPAKDMATKVRLVLANDNMKLHDTQLVSFGLWKPSMIFYAKRPIKRIKTKHPQRLVKALSAKGPCIVFTRERLESILQDIEGFFPIYANKGYLLGGNRKALLFFEKNAEKKTGIFIHPEIGKRAIHGGTLIIWLLFAPYETEFLSFSTST